MLRRRPVRNLALAPKFVDGGPFARGKALRSLSEERAEIQARREIEKVGGWRSDCATTQ